jgi:hypothetical protein
VRELRTPGSVRGVLSNEHPYRDSAPLISLFGGEVTVAIYSVAGLFAGRRRRSLVGF